jgi:hypothetical protein
MIDEETGKLNMKSFRGTLTSTTEAKKHSGMDYNSPLLRDTPNREGIKHRKICSKQRCRKTTLHLNRGKRTDS